MKECLVAILYAVRSLGYRGDSLPESTINHWLGLVDELDGNWLKVCKYKLNAFLAFHYGTEPVANPFTTSKDLAGKLFNGKLHTWLNGIVRARNECAMSKGQWRAYQDKRHSFLSTIASVKLICPRPSEETIAASVIDTFESLTGAKPVPRFAEGTYALWGDNPWRPRQMLDGWEELWDEGEGVIDEPFVRLVMRSVIQEVFQQVPEEGWLEKPIFPATRATVDSSIKDGGGVRDFLGNEDARVSELARPGGYLGPMEECIDFIDEWEDLKGSSRFKFATTLELEQAFAQSLGGCRASAVRKARGQELHLKPIGLAEPLKVRVITKGPGDLYMATAHLQIELARQLKRHPVFVLTGEPVTMDIIASRLGRLEPGKKFLNGDYTAATNNIRSWISRIYSEEIADHFRLSNELRELLVAGMVENIILDPSTRGRQGRRQTDGQPMGFVNSFVGLCICNATIAKIIRCYDTGSIATTDLESLRDMPILVNGDDLCMQSSDGAYKLWERVGAYVGLSPSIGKTYFTSEFAQINSRNFLYEEGVYRSTYALNMGLLKGVAKKGGNVSIYPRAERIAQTSCNYRMLMEDCGHDIEKKKRVHKLFFLEHGDFVRSFRIPHYVPTWCGGLGFTGFFLPDELDRRRMRLIRLNYSRLRPKALPLGEKSWAVHQLAADKLPPVNLTFHKDDPGVQEYARAIGTKSVDLLYDASYDLGDLLKGDTLARQMAQRNLRHNDRLWCKISKVTHLPAPLTYEEAGMVTMYETLGCAKVGVMRDEEDDWVVIDAITVEPAGRELELGDNVPVGFVSRD